MGNTGAGVVLFESANNTIGGTVAGSANVISANHGSGILLNYITTTDNEILGNLIGTHYDGQTGLGNGFSGISIQNGASSNTIGGTIAAARNVIADNSYAGIDLYSLGLQLPITANVIVGNYIGLDSYGHPLGNHGPGVALDGTTGDITGTTIGGTTAGAGNVISGNDTDGVSITGITATDNFVLGNLIGTDTSGQVAIANQQEGIDLNVSTSGVTIVGNVISGNGEEGIGIGEGSNNLIAGNLIGTNLGGTYALGNGQEGIYDFFGSMETIGGTTAAARNIISGNSVGISAFRVTGLVIESDYIGTDISGANALGNLAQGILEQGAISVTIGGTVAGVATIVSGNGIGASTNQGAGIQLDGYSTGTTIIGTYVGVALNGSSVLGNNGAGILIEVASFGNIVGGTDATDADVISGNGLAGVLLQSGANGNVIEGDFIGTDSTGETELVSQTYGVDISFADVNTVGGTAAGSRNVISGNTGDGVALVGDVNGGVGNVVEGNYIGLDSGGTLVLGTHQEDGVLIQAGYNTIGGTTAAARNVISGDFASGIRLDGANAIANLIVGNYIGTEYTGSIGIGDGYGVFNLNATGNTIGGTSAGAGNVISANDVGIYIENSGLPAPQSGVAILGNLIGTDQSGQTALGNLNDGIYATSSSGTTIIDNLISGNGGDGIDGDNYSDLLISGNFVGTNLGGTAAIANAGSGIFLQSNSELDTTIGGVTAADRNIISGNGGDGISIGMNTSSQATGLLIESDYIGTDVSGTIALGNAFNGIQEVLGSGTTIGGTLGSALTVVSGNGTDMHGNGTEIGIHLMEATHALVIGTYVGVGSDGVTTITDHGAGIEIDQGAADNTIGGTAAGDTNVISGNVAGIELHGTSVTGNLIQGNYIGTDATGTIAVANTEAGIYELDAPDNTIGGTDAGAGNVISGNSFGIQIASNDIANRPTFALIEGNLIGTDETGLVALANLDYGIYFSNAVGSTVGGTATGARNIISGNASTGIYVDVNGNPSPSGELIEGNWIGLDKDGGPLGNRGQGITLALGDGNTIGGTSAGAGNVISANIVQEEIEVDTNDNLIAGNMIGTTPDGSATDGDGLGEGIYITGGHNTIGGIEAIGATGPGPRNIIGNAYLAVFLSGASASSNLFEGNYVGVNAAGNAALGAAFTDPVLDAHRGVAMDYTASDNTIGGTMAGAGNLISGYTQYGIDISGQGTTGNLIEGNVIGTDATGMFAIGDGIGVQVILSADHTTIGGSVAGAGNLISGSTNGQVVVQGALSNVILGNLIGTNAKGTAAVTYAAGLEPTTGVTLYGTDDILGTPGVGNLISGNGFGVQFGDVGGVVQGNMIGTDITGTRAVPNSYYGVVALGFSGPLSETIGGTAIGAGNVISGNGFFGISLLNSASGITIVNNLIGTNRSGLAAVPNYFYGIDIEGGSSNITVGGTAAGSRNVISGNLGSGIFLDPTATAVIIQSNYIGTDITGEAAVGNGTAGVLIEGEGVQVGGSVFGAGNVISGNGQEGVWVREGAQDIVEGNYIGTDATGTKAVGNGYGVLLDGATSTTVGGTAFRARNVISGNLLVGVVFEDGSASNLIEGDYIGTDQAGTAALGNGTSGILIGGSGGDPIEGECDRRDRRRLAQHHLRERRGRHHALRAERLGEPHPVEFHRHRPAGHDPAGERRQRDRSGVGRRERDDRRPRRGQLDRQQRVDRGRRHGGHPGPWRAGPDQRQPHLFQRQVWAST